MIYSIKDSVVPPTSTENLSKQINNLRGIVKLNRPMNKNTCFFVKF